MTFYVWYLECRTVVICYHEVVSPGIYSAETAIYSDADSSSFSLKHLVSQTIRYGDASMHKSKHSCFFAVEDECTNLTPSF